MKLIFGLCSAMVLICVILGSAGMGQTTGKVENITLRSKNSFSTEIVQPDNSKTRPTDAERITLLEEALRRQMVELASMRQVLQQQQLLIQTLYSKAEGIVPQHAVTGAVAEAAKVDGTTANSTERTDVAPGGAGAQVATVDQRLKKLEDRVLQVGPFKFSGDFRLRADGILRSASKAPDPPLAHAQNVRARYRLRLNFDTDVNPVLSFHGQLATGPVNNELTLDQDFSSTTARHPFFLSEAWIDYHPRKSLQLQAGRVQEVFADNSRFLFDDDVRFNGFNEKYIWSLKQKPLDLT